MGEDRGTFDNYHFKGSQLHLSSKGSSEDEVIDTDDIINGIESTSKGEENIHIIQKLETRQWKKKVLKVVVKELDTKHNLASEWNTIREKTMTSRPRRLLVLISSISGAQKSQHIYQTIVAPLFELAKITTDVIVTERHNHILDIISTYPLQDIDGVVVFGGDGSYSQCANSLLERTQKDANIDYNDPDVKFKPTSLPIGHIPTGSMNLMSRMCFGCIDVETAALGIIKGKTYDIGITNVYADQKWVRSALIGIYHGNINEFTVYVENFRWLKAARYAIMLPYYTFMKMLPRIDAELKLLYSNACYSEVEKETKPTEETIQGTFLEFMTTSQTVYRSDSFLGSPNFITGCFWMFLFSTDCSRWQLFKNYMKALLDADNHVNPDFVQEKKIIGYKVKINNSNINHAASEGKHLYYVGVDGEILHLQTPQWEVRHQDSVVKVFTSLL